MYILPQVTGRFWSDCCTAMASGLPVVGTNIYGLRLLKNGRNCITYEPDNINKAFLACCKFIENKKLRKKLGMQGRKKIVKNFQEKDLIRILKNF